MQGLIPSLLQDRTDRYALIVAEEDQKYPKVEGDPPKNSSLCDMMFMLGLSPFAVVIC